MQATSGVSRPDRSQPPQSKIGNLGSTIQNRISKIANRQLRFSCWRVPRNKRILFSTFEAGMCMKTNRTRKNDMPIGRQLRRTKSDFADNCSSVRTNWVESGGLSERIWTGRTMDFRQPEHAGRGNRDRYFLVFRPHTMPMPENVVSAPGYVSDKRSPPVPRPSEFSGMFTILLSWRLTRETARRMTSLVRGRWKIKIRKRKSGGEA